MVNQTHLGAVVLSVIGGVLAGFGVVLSVDAWTTMQQIEAQGMIGQAIYEQQYESAADTLRYSVLAAVLGISLIMGSSIEYLRGTIKELSE